LISQDIHKTLQAKRFVERLLVVLLKPVNLDLLFMLLDLKLFNLELIGLGLLFEGFVFTLQVLNLFEVEELTGILLLLNSLELSLGVLFEVADAVFELI